MMKRDMPWNNEPEPDSSSLAMSIYDSIEKAWTWSSKCQPWEFNSLELFALRKTAHVRIDLIRSAARRDFWRLEGVDL